MDVQFQDIEDSQSAIDNMNGFQLFDTFIHVTRAKNDTSLESTIEPNKPIWETADTTTTDT